MSAQKEARVEAAKQINGPRIPEFGGDPSEMVAALHDALYSSKICSYAQGMNLIREGSATWNWKINLSEIARIWQAGCIIRARFLKRIKEAYLRQPQLPNLLLDQEFKQRIEQSQDRWRSTINEAIQRGVPVLAMSSSIGYFDMYRTAQLPLNLTQAQRDFFGSHTYERVDKPETGPIHTEWEELL
jgi:6-phosphogluconate dehydrogenase